MDLRDNRRLWGIGEVLSLSWPAGLSMLNSTFMRFVDGLMVSYLGPAAFGAQMVASLAAFAPESFATGLLTVVNTYVAQNLGAGRLHRCGQYAWAGLAMAMFYSCLIAPLAFFAWPIFVAMNQPAELLGYETLYFRYMVAAIFLTLTARPIEQFFYGIHRPRVVLAASLISNISNLGLGYLLIFGQSGFIVLTRNSVTAPIGHYLTSVPILQFQGLGLRGAAIGTVISWALYLAILLTMFLGTKLNQKYSTRRPRLLRLRHCVELLRIGWPAGLQFFADVLPWTVMLSALVAPFGVAHSAASSAAMRWMPLSFMPAVGIGVATTALVGRYIGQGRRDLARRRVHAALVLAVVYMGVCGLLFAVFREPMVRLFVNILPSDGLTPQQVQDMGDEIVRIGQQIMILAAIFQLFDAIGIVFVGALRGAGDTFWPMLAVVITSFTITIGGGFLAVTFLPQLGSVGPWMAGSLYVIVLGLVLAWRFESGRWAKIDLLHRRPEVVEASAAAPSPTVSFQGKPPQN